MNELELFIEAVQRTDPAERAAYLARTVGCDVALRRRIELLLEADSEADDVLEEPAPPDAESPTEAAPDLDPSSESTLPFADEPDEPSEPATEVATGLEPGGTLPLVGEACDSSLEAPDRTASDGPQATPNGAERPVDGRDAARRRSDGPAGPRFGAPALPGLAQFELLAELGHGGMGVVYKARDRSLNRIVALKMVRDGKHGHAEYRKRFRIEAEAVGRLHHPNIIQVYHFGEADGYLFVTLELLEGGSLADRLKGTTQPGRTAAELVETLARAMHVAHLAGIIHRDLKPSNVVFDREGTPKITDFGLAKRLEVEEGQTESGQIMGTPSYMAPEQAQGDVHRIGPPADVYALGAILYEALTGRPPFKGPNSVSTLRQVVYEDVVPPSWIEPRIARDLETICLKCLQKELSKRYGTALELADDLRCYLENRPILARRTPLYEHGAKWVLRHPATTLALALTTAAFLVLTVLAVHWDAAHRAKVLEDQQKLAERKADTERRLDEAQARLLGNDWAQGRFLLGQLVAELKHERGLDEIGHRAQRMLDQSEQKRLDLDEERRAQDCLRTFVEHRNEALLHETRFTGLDMPADIQATRASAHTALSVFAQSRPDDSWTFLPWPRAFSQEEQAAVRDDCYQLLLVLAEAVGEVLPGENPKIQADRGLRLLDQASGLRAEPTSAWHRARAVCLATKRDDAAAARARAAADVLRPTTVLDYFLAGRAAYRQQDPTRALAEFETVLRKQPGHFWALCLSAMASLQTHQPGAAKLGLDGCIQQQPQLTALYVLRGVAAHQAALQARTEAKSQKLEDDAIETAAEPQFEAAETDYREALALLGKRPNDDLRYTVMVDRAVLRLQRGRLDEAVTDLEEAIRINGRYSNAFESLALVLQRQRKWDDAVERFTQAIRLKPGSAPLHRARAAVQQEREDQSAAHRAAALLDLDEAIRCEKADTLLAARDHIQRGELLRRDGRFEKALAACDAALKLAPELDTAHGLRVNVLVDLGRTDEVIGSCDGALARGKPWPGIHEIRGLARANRGDFAGAIEDYSQALVLRPDQPRVLTSRGQAYLVAGAPKLALHDFNEALRRDPASGEAHSGRGRALALLGDHRAATAAAEESLRHDSSTARRAYNAARIYALAALAAAAEVGEGRLRATTVESYQDRAVALVKLALERTPPERRAAFWQDDVAADPALRSLLRRLRLLQPPGAPGAPAAPGRSRYTAGTL
jgi:tetratricopeptide (TPR) repeat protein/tRNA A-37 threonylcarbamoyl transferase component Bud32